MIFAGLRKVVDYQDVAYGHHYLDVLKDLLARERRHGGEARGFALTETAAKYLANAFCYDDLMRVADLKTRPSRFERIVRESGGAGDAILDVTEFMHPRMEEVAGAMPRKLGRFIEARPKLFAALDRIVNRGWRVRSGTIPWFLALYLLAGAKRFRPGSLRHARELEHIEGWLGCACEVLPKDYDLAVEVLRCRRLVKGYSDTHARGLSKFDRVLAAVPMLVGKPGGAAWLRRLVEAALADEMGSMLEGALQTAASAYQAV
jgi:indolepyruvate ferredoxin oxidoreductase beta subunit